AELKSAEPETSLPLVCCEILTVRIRSDFLGGKTRVLKGRHSHCRRAAAKHRTEHCTETEEPALHRVRLFVTLRDSQKGAIDHLLGLGPPAALRAFLPIMPGQLRDQMRRVVRHTQSKMIRGSERRGFDAVTGVEQRRVRPLDWSRPHGDRSEA